MRFSVISSLVLVAFIGAIVTIEASPSPIRLVTPKPGINYKIRTVTPNPRIRYLRSIDENEFSAEPIVEEDFFPRHIRSTEEDIINGAVNVVDDLEHAISKRSPQNRRVVINYTPPPPHGPRYARSADAEEVEVFEE